VSMVMTKKTIFFFIILVFLPALVIRIHPVASESFQYDAVVSQRAAAEGVLANALDEGDALSLRRYHPPLLSYIILMNNAVFGGGAFGARVFSMVFGALTCLAVSFSIAQLLRYRSGGGAWAIFGGWMLCLLPAHLYVSRTANWDAVYGFFAAGSLFSLSIYLLAPTGARLAMAAVFSSLAFLTSELGLALLPAVAFVALRDWRRASAASVCRRWATMFALAVVIVVALWPAGLFKLDLARTLLFRWRDSLGDERNLPWYMFYVVLFRQSPAFAVTAGVGVVLWAGLLLRIRFHPTNRADASNTVIASMPFLIYVLTSFVLSLEQRLVFVHHIADMFPPLVVVVCAAIGVWMSTLNRFGKSVVAGLGIVVLGFSIYAATNPDAHVVGPQEHPGFLGIRDALVRYPDARIFCYDVMVLRFYLPEKAINGSDSRRWSPQKIRMIKDEEFEFVVFDRKTFDAGYPDAGSVAEALTPEYELWRVIHHERSGEPVAWILKWVEQRR
jgi:hypothetical protein